MIDMTLIFKKYPALVELIVKLNPERAASKSNLAPFLNSKPIVLFAPE